MAKQLPSNVFEEFLSDRELVHLFLFIQGAPCETYCELTLSSVLVEINHKFFLLKVRIEGSMENKRCLALLLVVSGTTPAFPVSSHVR